MEYYKCENCNDTFNEPNIKHTTYEHYYGAPIPTSTPLKLETCPHCGCDEFHELETEDELKQEGLL